MLKRGRSKFLILAVLVLFGSTTTGCSGGSSPDSAHEVHMAPLDQMPADVQGAPIVVQQAYRFAVANPEVTKQLPCYCGCGAMGHTSNYACYVQSVDASGAITFDPHAFGCSICVDITQDAMRLLQEGKGVEAIRATIDDTYSRFGPSNMP